MVADGETVCSSKVAARNWMLRINQLFLLTYKKKRNFFLCRHILNKCESFVSFKFIKLIRKYQRKWLFIPKKKKKKKSKEIFSVVYNHKAYFFFLFFNNLKTEYDDMKIISNSKWIKVSAALTKWWNNWITAKQNEKQQLE